MTDFWIYAKALTVSSAALFGVTWCVCGINVALMLIFQTVLFLLAVAAVLGFTVTVLFWVCDRRNKYYDEYRNRKHEKSSKFRRVARNAARGIRVDCSG
jgi:hypothetical protein